jgi:hypothetical protein
VLSHRNAMHMRYATRLPLRPLLSVANIHGWDQFLHRPAQRGKEAICSRVHFSRSSFLQLFTAQDMGSQAEDQGVVGACKIYISN